MDKSHFGWKSLPKCINVNCVGLSAYKDAAVQRKDGVSQGMCQVGCSRANNDKFADFIFLNLLRYGLKASGHADWKKVPVWLFHIHQTYIYYRNECKRIFHVWNQLNSQSKAFLLQYPWFAFLFLYPWFSKFDPLYINTHVPSFML